MYPPHHLGGYELIWRGAVEHLRARGHSIRILTTDHREAMPDPAIPEDPDCHRELRWYWREHGFPRLGPHTRLAIERHNATVLDSHVRDWAPDVVAWWAMGGMSMALIERIARAGLPSLAVVMDDWPSYGPAVDGWQRPLRGRPRIARAVERLTGVPVLRDLARATRWVVISDFQRDRLERLLGTGLDARIANAGVDGRLFGERPDHDWAWQLVYCGRMDARKGIDLAVSALPLLPTEARLRIVGDGDPAYREELRALAAGLGVAERVSFERVPRDRLADVFASGDVLLFPVRWEEPWGLVPLEAMAVGMRVVASGRGGSGEYLADRQNCLLADPDGGAEALAAAVAELGADAAMRRRLREGGLATAARYPDTAFADAVEAAAEEAVR
jgi:glycosyltransferase involved in cell wall biosynthesis